MRFIVPSVVALATSAAGLLVSVGTDCLDVTKDFVVTWDIDGDNRVGPELTFNMWNEKSGHTIVNDSFPIGDPTPLRVDSSLNKTTLHAVPAAKADSYRNNAGGPDGFQIRVNDPETYTPEFTIAAAGGGC